MSQDVPPWSFPFHTASHASLAPFSFRAAGAPRLWSGGYLLMSLVSKCKYPSHYTNYCRLSLVHCLFLHYYYIIIYALLLQYYLITTYQYPLPNIIKKSLLLHYYMLLLCYYFVITWLLYNYYTLTTYGYPLLHIITKSLLLDYYLLLSCISEPDSTYMHVCAYV